MENLTTLDEINTSVSNWSSLSSFHQPSSTYSTDVSSKFMLSIVMLFNVFSIGGNLLILKVVPRIPSDEMTDSTKVCYMGQAATDAIASTLYYIGPLAETIGEWIGWMYGRMTFCKVIGLLICSFPVISTLHIALLNTDRYLFIVRPMLYSRIATRKLVLCTSILLSLLSISLMIAFVYIHSPSGELLLYHRELRMCIVDFQEPSFAPFSVCLCAVPWIVVISLVFQYCHIVKISLNHLRRLEPLAVRVQCTNSDNALQDAKSDHQSDPLPGTPDRHKPKCTRHAEAECMRDGPHGSSSPHHLAKDQNYDGCIRGNLIRTSSPFKIYMEDSILVHHHFNEEVAGQLDTTRKNLSHNGADGHSCQRKSFFEDVICKPAKDGDINPCRETITPDVQEKSLLGRPVGANVNPSGSTKTLNRPDEPLTIVNYYIEMSPDSANAKSVGATKTHAKNPSVSTSGTPRRVDVQMLSAEPNVGDCSQERSQAHKPPKFSILRQNLRILRTPIIVTSCLFITFIPITFVILYEASTGQRLVNDLFHAVFSRLLCVSGGFNIINYYFTIVPFRQKLKNTLKCR